MTATIATLLDASWIPTHPTHWITRHNCNAKFKNDSGIHDYEVLFHLERDLENGTWKNASEAHGGAGLDQGIPNFSPAAKVYKCLVKEGKLVEARALQVLLTNRAWCGERLLQAGIIEDEAKAVCRRCHLNVLETPHHKFYGCPDNQEIRNIKNSQKSTTHTI